MPFKDDYKINLAFAFKLKEKTDLHLAVVKALSADEEYKASEELGDYLTKCLSKCDATIAEELYAYLKTQRDNLSEKAAERLKEYKKSKKASSKNTKSSKKDNEDEPKENKKKTKQPDLEEEEVKQEEPLFPVEDLLKKIEKHAENEANCEKYLTILKDQLYRGQEISKDELRRLKAVFKFKVNVQNLVVLSLCGVIIKSDKMREKATEYLISAIDKASL